MKKNPNEDFFLKEYIKYHNNKKQKKFSNKFNYILKLKKNNKNPSKKSSSFLFHSSRKDNNNSDFIINNQFPKKENIIQNKTIFNKFLLNNNNKSTNSKGNVSNNLIVNHNNNYNKDNKQIKYHKLKLKKKGNNSFRVNHIKKLYKDEKINIIKQLYVAHIIDRNDSLNKKSDKKNFGKTYIYSQKPETNHKRVREGKSNDKKIPKIPIYLNNNSNLSGENSDNFDTNRKTYITNFKLNGTKKDFNIKYANSLNNISYKDKSFNFNRKVPKLISSEKNNLFNKNNLNGKSRTNTNMKIKNFDRINSAGKFKSVGYKYDKVNSLNNNIKQTSKEKMGNRSNSNRKDKFHYFLAS